MKTVVDAVSDLMIDHGPDGHCDGAEVIAVFIGLLLDGSTIEAAYTAADDAAKAKRGPITWEDRWTQTK